MVGEYIEIGKNLYKHNKHHYVIKKCKNCEKDFFCRKDKITTKNTCNPFCYQQLIEKNKKYTLSEKTMKIIIGSLLSDGCITKGKSAKNYHYTHFSKEEEYIDFLLSQMNIKLSKHKLNPRKTKKYISKGGFYFNTKYSVTFTELRQKWYPFGSKIVPKDIQLDNIILLHWYLGDGHISNQNGIQLCTDSFDDYSISLLIKQLQNLGFSARKNKRNRISIPNKSVYEFLKYIGECPIKCFDYKWKTIVEKSYKNRSCINCEKIFDANTNHKKYCSDKCSIAYSNKYKNKLKLLKSKKS